MKNEDLYTKYSEEGHWERRPTVYAERFRDHLHENNFEGLVVDLGCGTGRDVNVFKLAGFRVGGVDSDEKYFETAKERCPNVDIQLANIEALPFEDEFVDAYYMVNVIHYLDQRKAICEIYRTLRPGGYLFVHFNVFICDAEGNVDYDHDIEDIYSLVDGFDIIDERRFQRVDREPVEHTHDIIELILHKPH